MGDTEWKETGKSEYGTQQHATEHIDRVVSK